MFRDLPSDRCAVFACASKIQREMIHEKKTASKTVHIRLRGVWNKITSQQQQKALRHATGKGTVFRDMTSDLCAVFACASRIFREKWSMQKRPRQKACMYALMAYKRRSLGAAAKCACVQSKWAFLGAPTSDRSALFASASNRFQTKRYSKKDRVQNRALTPS